MVTRTLLLSLSLLAAAACGAPIDPGAGRCDGAKCDGSELPALGEIALRDVLRCWQSAAGELQCQLRDRTMPSVELSYWVAEWRPDSGRGRFATSVRREDLSPSPVVLGAIAAEAFPGTLRVGVALTAKDSGTYDFGAERHFSTAAELSALRESAPFSVDLPVKIWPVRLWPKDATVDGALVSYTTTTQFPLPDSRLPYAPSQRLTEVSQTLSGFHQEGDAWETLGVLVPSTGGAPSLAITIYSKEGATLAERTHTLGAPGYHVLDADGAIALTAVGELPNRPAADPSTPPVDDAPDMTPAAPVDPCRGSCGATQVCVAGACVARADQIQSSYCDTPFARCDAGEDGDCADGHVCAAGLCRRLTCQVQDTLCNSPRAVCDDAADCGAGHACVESRCVRLSPCQTQDTLCNPPQARCATAADCASGHSCDGGVCRRNGC